MHHVKYQDISCYQGSRKHETNKIHLLDTLLTLSNDRIRWSTLKSLVNFTQEDVVNEHLYRTITLNLNQPSLHI